MFFIQQDKITNGPSTSFLHIFYNYFWLILAPFTPDSFPASGKSYRMKEQIEDQIVTV